jgi:arsenate reductase
LFLCTGNSARSIIAESALRQLGESRFHAYSAGSHPKGAVHPLAIEVLESKGLPTVGLRSKPWDEFAVPGAPKMDFVFTVCDDAAGEACPVWPGQPVTAHWGVADPAACDGDDDTRRRAFADACDVLTDRVKRFTDLPLGRLDDAALKTALRRIGSSEP